MTLEETRRMRRNWRGRRYLACSAAGELAEVIENLAADDGTHLPPEGGLPVAPSQAIIVEMQNTVATLLRLILLYNDGSVSPQKLHRF